MNDVPLDEANELLLWPRRCIDAPDWKYNKLQPGTTILECGLVEEDDSYSGLQVALVVSRSSKTKQRTFKFTLFHAQLGGLRRVYQLHITATAHRPKNWHEHAHEHLGTTRREGQDAWLDWDFQQALDYFCAMTSISFEPPIEDPEAFKLTSPKSKP